MNPMSYDIISFVTHKKWDKVMIPHMQLLVKAMHVFHLMMAKLER